MEDVGVSSSQFEDFVVTSAGTNEARELKVQNIYLGNMLCDKYETFKVETESIVTWGCYYVHVSHIFLLDLCRTLCGIQNQWYGF